MARKLIPQQYDTFSDLSGEKLPQDGWTHVKIVYTVDGEVTRTELDLSKDEEKVLADLLFPYLTCVKPVTGTDASANGAGSTKHMRDWAKDVATKAGGKYVVTLGDDTEPTTLETPSAQGRLDGRWVQAFHQYEAEVKAQAEAAAKGK